MQQGAEMVKKIAAILVMAVLHLVVACAPAAPTPTRTPKPTPTPAEVRATKAEHLAGIWRLGGGEGNFTPTYGGRYYRWDADGTVWWAHDAEMTTTVFSASYWFEDGLYHEGESAVCLSAGCYEAYLVIEEGRGVRLRLQVINDGFAIDGCPRRSRYAAPFRRVD
jgi:hypothetical protein